MDVTIFCLVEVRFAPHLKAHGQEDRPRTGVLFEGFSAWKLEVVLSHKKMGEMVISVQKMSHFLILFLRYPEK